MKRGRQTHKLYCNFLLLQRLLIPFEELRKYRLAKLYIVFLQRKFESRLTLLYNLLFHLMHTMNIIIYH